MALDVTKIIGPLQGALAPVGNTLGDTWAAIIGDRVAAWRIKNAVKLQAAVHAQVAALGLELDRSKIPERYAVTWFEEATKQDECEIQELFARILARAASGDEDALDRRHLEIITTFTPMDAKVFQWFFDKPRPYPWAATNEYELYKSIKAEIGASAWKSVEHLLVVGVLERDFLSCTRFCGHQFRLH